ncbi:Progressive ankylosis protein homolog [Geodia barretti]|uniref:Progressive ankylosis protein homolog n=1 Tax=Geodia barretti TaxID=519541 RepID=A0AA35SB02_GEOBA|nr:Progressive ankylosis protein homolog [Geodia barretti]
MKGVVNLRRGLGMQSRIRQWFSVIVRSDYYVLTRFLFPLSFTVIAVDIGEQFLNRSLAQSANVVNVLAAFGLSFIIVKVFSGVLGEIRHAGLVLVHDRPGLPVSSTFQIYCSI